MQFVRRMRSSGNVLYRGTRRHHLNVVPRCVATPGSRHRAPVSRHQRNSQRPPCSVLSDVVRPKLDYRVVEKRSERPRPGRANLQARPLVKETGEVVAMILGGGSGKHLWPLTNVRAEPAVPLAGYRLIDFPVSNCVHSNINQIYVFTQFNSMSLNTHLASSYQFLSGSKFGANREFVESLHATRTPDDEEGWYRGTADAVRRFTYLLQEHYHKDCQDVLILMGDQLYQMDYQRLLNFHRLNNADVTIASTPCDEAHACDLGVLQVDTDYRVHDFCEKPVQSLLATMSIDTTQFGLSERDANQKPFMASMGVYVFKKSVLLDLLHQQFPQGDDFSRDILPYALHHLKIMAFPFLGYWEDVGTVKNYYNACMMLAKDDSKLRLWERENPVFTEARMFPPTKMTNSEVVQSLVNDGCVLCGTRVVRSLLGPGTYLAEGSQLQDMVTFGADTFETAAMRRDAVMRGEVPLGVGENSVLRRCIVDKNVRIGRDCQLVNKSNIKEGSRGDVVIRDGILVIPKETVIPNGTII